MTATENIETVTAIYEAFGRGDVDAIVEKCADDVDWSTDAANEVAPWHGVRHGHAELPSFFEGIAQTGSVDEFTPLSFAANDNDEVMVLIRFAFTSNATGKSASMHLHHYWRLRDGKVAYYRGSEDTALVAETIAP